jgi:cytidylate kinase
MDEPLLDIVTIDGPAGVGKSTVSRSLAMRLVYTYLDTGAMYRALAYGCVTHKIDPHDAPHVARTIQSFIIRLDSSKSDQEDTLVYLNDEEVSRYIRTPDIAAIASQISAYKPVRDKLTLLQQKIGEQGHLVAEGRDTGTVVFPKAAWKFFLDASPETRAKRRYLQLKNQGVIADENEILSLIVKRDKADRERSLAPLKAAGDAVVIDSSNMTAHEVVDTMEKYVVSGR